MSSFIIQIRDFYNNSLLNPEEKLYFIGRMLDEENLNIPPVVTVSSTNQESFQRYCLEYISQGYVLSSSNCSTATFQGQTDEFWQAILVLSSEKV